MAQYRSRISKVAARMAELVRLYSDKAVQHIFDSVTRCVNATADTKIARNVTGAHEL